MESEQRARVGGQVLGGGRCRAGDLVGEPGEHVVEAGTALGMFRHLPQGPLERAEGVEMLRFIDNGHTVWMLGVGDDGLAVDTPEDLARAGTLLRTHAKPVIANFS
ncbi:hypothetical protein [Streptomyces sp. NBC_00996]|uniref:hypothetical protein n=1 Tax=Streptomyces sp. NBC_00996 TaxID=2903710 RepID=UPI003869D2D7|nr:hypothetical protein OG390_02915 [Streptomyces sp. NBC_00996]